jgi:NAD(P)-dependent dehydrogenase (short-subunit alcohol dehydrogenase family)
MSDQQAALVTGGGSGIGLSIARRLCAEGFHTIVLDLAPPAPGALDGPWQFVPGDVTMAADLAASVGLAVEGGRRLKAVIHCAGTIEPAGALEELPDEWIAKVVNVNLLGSILLAKAAIPAMKKAGGSTLIQIGSIAGERGSPNHPVYSATKAALNGLTKSLAARYGRNAIRVVTVCPGSVPDTGFARLQLGRDLTEEERLRLIARIPLGRPATPEFIADLVAFLISPAARHITGCLIPVDGGELTSAR